MRIHIVFERKELPAIPFIFLQNIRDGEKELSLFWYPNFPVFQKAVNLFE
jgi:hypothetical protein